MRTLALLIVLACGVVLLGCPPGTCFLEVCSNGQCKCHLSSCIDGAEFDTTTRRCACNADRLSVSGQCLTQADANAFCGRGFNHVNGGCQKIACAAGSSLDEATGQCVNNASVAGNVGVQLGQGETIQCPAGSVLIIEGQSGACVPQEQTCAPDEHWIGNACAKMASCPTGWKYDVALNNCVEFAKSGDGGAIVDVAQWANSSYGSNGGKGTTSYCNRFVHKPWRFGISQGQAATLNIAVQLQFPGSDVKAGTVGTKVSFVGSPLAVPAGGVQAVQTAAQEVLSTLAKGGGQANAPQAQTTVNCIVRNAAAPIVVPATGGV